MIVKAILDTMRLDILKILNTAETSALTNTLRGVERECLRITPHGHIAMTPHPQGLGSPLTNPTITTDYSEAMIEIITSPCNTIEKCLTSLEELHTFVYKNLENDELLWTSSMPCIVSRETNIPPARFGTSNEGKIKELYRKGLKHRYGSIMQSIAGIHFNFSFPQSFWDWLFKVQPDLFSENAPSATVKDFRTAGYLHILRNFLRTGWILTLLFGSTPAMCTNYLGENANKLDLMNEHTSYLPFATSLRSSHLGYQSSAQKKLFIGTDTLTSYCRDLTNASVTPWPRFSEIYKADRSSQINDSILQIENEYYSSIRPKQASGKNPRITTGLRNHGIEYVEVRSLDVNSYEPTGISAEQIMFIEALLLNCLLTKSPPIAPSEAQVLKENVETIATRGRDPRGRIKLKESSPLIRDEAQRLVDEVVETAGVLDRSYLSKDDNTISTLTYSSAARRQKTILSDYSLLPSSKILTSIESSKLEFFHLGMKLTTKTASHFQKNILKQDRDAELTKIAAESILKQKIIESKDDISFARYLKEYTSKDSKQPIKGQ